jgi:DNA mismatch endonuclease (patch repair protein)
MGQTHYMVEHIRCELGIEMDILDAKARSDLMSKIRSKNTKPEKAVRSYLHRRGLRYRLHDRNLPGVPDLAFSRKRVVVFVHGCFWHGHEGCKKATIPQTRPDFWREKINGNRARDNRNMTALEKQGWRVIVVWECELSDARLDLLWHQVIAS